MVVYNLVIFNRNGVNVFSRYWGDIGEVYGDHEMKLFFGLIFQTKYFCKTMSPKPLATLQMPDVFSLATNEYKLFIHESPSGWRIAMMTDPDVQDPQGRSLLERIYRLLVDKVLKNPLYTPHAQISSTIFHKQLSNLVENSLFH